MPHTYNSGRMSRTEPSHLSMPEGLSAVDAGDATGQHGRWLCRPGAGASRTTASEPMGSPLCAGGDWQKLPAGDPSSESHSETVAKSWPVPATSGLGCQRSGPRKGTGALEPKPQHSGHRPQNGAWSHGHAGGVAGSTPCSCKA